ncbi:unnamed protein product [Arctogadus glacialis]
MHALQDAAAGRSAECEALGVKFPVSEDLVLFIQGAVLVSTVARASMNGSRFRGICACPRCLSAVFYICAIPFHSPWHSNQSAVSFSGTAECALAVEKQKKKEKMSSKVTVHAVVFRPLGGRPLAGPHAGTVSPGRQARMQACSPLPKLNPIPFNSPPPARVYCSSSSRAEARGCC